MTKEPLLDEIDVYRRLKAWRKAGVRKDAQIARALVRWVEAELAARQASE